MKINVADSIGKNAVTQRAGNALYEMIHGPLRNNERVVIDFSGIGVYSSPFFNNSIGRLFADIDEEAIKRHLDIINISQVGADVVRRVIENAKIYYSMSEEDRAARDRMTGEFFDSLDH